MTRPKQLLGLVTAVVCAIWASPLTRGAATQEKEAPRAPILRAVLLETCLCSSNPEMSIAILKAVPEGTKFLGFIGEPLRPGGKASNEFEGWKLVEVLVDRAVFENNKVRVVLMCNVEK